MVALWPGRMLPLMTMGHDALWHFRLLSNFILCSGCASEGFQSSGFRASNGQSEPYTPFAYPHHPEGPKSDRSC